MAAHIGGGHLDKCTVEFPMLGLRVALVELAPIICGYRDTELFYAEHPGSPHARPWTKKDLALEAFWRAGCQAVGMDPDPTNY